MIHPHLGKHDLSKKRFYQIIMLVCVLTFVIVTLVVWQVERRVDTQESAQESRT